MLSYSNARQFWSLTIKLKNIFDLIPNSHTPHSFWGWNLSCIKSAKAAKLFLHFPRHEIETIPVLHLGCTAAPDPLLLLFGVTPTAPRSVDSGRGGAGGPSPGGVTRARWRGRASPAGAPSPGTAFPSSPAPPGASAAFATSPAAARALSPPCHWSWRGTEPASEGHPRPPRKCHHLREEESNTRVRGAGSSSHHNTGRAWLQWEHQ